MSDERKTPPYLTDEQELGRLERERPYVDPLLAAGRPPEARDAPRYPKAPRPARPAAGPGILKDEPGAGGALPTLLGSGDPAAAAAGQTLKSQADFYRQRRRQERQAKNLARIAKVDNQIRQEASRILLDSFAAAELNVTEIDGKFGPVDVIDPTKKPEGWSDRKFRTARDARRSTRDAPRYLQDAARIVESFRRSEALEKEGAPAPTLNCEIQVQVNNQYNYEVIEQKGD